MASLDEAPLQMRIADKNPSFSVWNLSSVNARPSGSVFDSSEFATIRVIAVKAATYEIRC